MWLAGCASGPHGSAEEKRAYFQKLETETLARLAKERPATTAQLAQAVGYAVVEQKIVKIPVFGAGKGTGVIVDRADGKRTYVRVPQLLFGAGWGARNQRVVLIFQSAAILRDLADGEWHAGLTAEASAKAASAGAGAAENTDKVEAEKKGYALYVLTEAGVSATVTLNLIRVQPFKID